MAHGKKLGLVLSPCMRPLNWLLSARGQLLQPYRGSDNPTTLWVQQGFEIKLCLVHNNNAGIDLKNNHSSFYRQSFGSWKGFRDILPLNNFTPPQGSIVHNWLKTTQRYVYWPQGDNNNRSRHCPSLAQTLGLQLQIKGENWDMLSLCPNT